MVIGSSLSVRVAIYHKDSRSIRVIFTTSPLAVMHHVRKIAAPLVDLNQSPEPATDQAGARLRKLENAYGHGSSPDSPLAGDGFEPSVPRHGELMKFALSVPRHGELMKFALTPCRSEQDSNFRSPATVSSVGAL